MRTDGLPGYFLRVAGWPLVLCMACVPADPPGGPRRKARGPARSSGGHITTRTEPSPKPTARSSASVGALPTSALPQGADAPLGAGFQDDFDRDSLGSSYRPTTGAWRMDAGQLCGQGARNHPVWLQRRLPLNARIEFDATAGSAEGDIKVEAWGDGRSGATGVSYTNATSYVFILGGWKNTLHVLARLDEHGADRRQLRVEPEADDPANAAVEVDRRYRFRIERRDGKTVRWFVDDIELVSFSDPAPLAAAGHEYFAFNDWEAPVCFDNLDILPLD